MTTVDNFGRAGVIAVLGTVGLATPFVHDYPTLALLAAVVVFGWTQVGGL